MITQSSRVATLALGVCAATVASPAAPPAIKRLDGTVISAAALTARIQDLVKKANVHGLAICFEHYSIVFPDRGLGVVIMTNSANGESIFKELLEVSIADTYTPWEWQDYVPYGK